jgi:hypothetical protein
MIIYYYILIVGMFFHELGHYFKARQYDPNIRIILDLRKETRQLGTEIPANLKDSEFKKIITCGILSGFVVIMIGCFSVNFNIYACVLINAAYFLMCNKDLKELMR